MTDPWRSRQFNDGVREGYTGEYLPTGERNWRMCRSRGEPIVFRTRNEALDAAKTAFLARYEPPLRATIERSPEESESRMAAKMQADAENWLKSNRRDVKGAETQYRAGKRPLKVMAGRA